MIHALLEISDNDITQLRDDDLRSLIGLLCEADYRSHQLSIQNILWGGHQDAPDGGIDVLVDTKDNPPSNSFIPKRKTIFQVKKTDMLPNRIKKEMQIKKKKILKPEIVNLSNEDGAYIIVSSAKSTPTELKRRVQAMRDAVDTLPIKFDFYDAGRIATWVRNHPSLILWVLNKIGRSLNGWKPYEDWSYNPQGISTPYLLDEKIKLKDRTTSGEQELTAEEGINKLRNILCTPRKSIRLTGLSGVGKTRFVQALFDSRIGTNPLQPNLAFYADISDNIAPDPKNMAEQIVAQKLPAIMVIDNCSSVLHKNLVSVCSHENSTISLITIEYDVREDLPEETEVFLLEPASEELIEKLVNNRYPYISQVDSITIARFSGGNARIAMALANTIKKGKSITGLKDEDLFKRLFDQRNDSNSDLLLSAEILSLVYSFQGTDTSSEESELKLLASLVSIDVNKLYRDVNELKKRDLIQCRGEWRAVLPHAIANRLAKDALEKIPHNTIVDTFLKKGSNRIITSFTRRLSYLHDSPTAQKIVENWLSEDGWLNDITNLNKFGISVFENIACVSPERTLRVIERAVSTGGQKFTSRNNPYYHQFTVILQNIAYDRELFERSINLIIIFDLSISDDRRYVTIRSDIKSLFYIKLSGTWASIDNRLLIIRKLWNQDSLEKQTMALDLLDACMEAWTFRTHRSFSFGARSRDYGFYPKSNEETIEWYTKSTKLTLDFALSDSPNAIAARSLMASKLRGLWTKVQLFDLVTRVCQELTKNNYWEEGWSAILSIIKYDAKKATFDIQNQLKELEHLLKPKTLIDQVRTYVLTIPRGGISNLSDESTESWSDKIFKKIHELGIEVAKSQSDFITLLPELLLPQNGYMIHFAKGLFTGTDNREELWLNLEKQFEITLPENRNLSIFQGYLLALYELNEESFNDKLDQIFVNQLFKDYCLQIQCSVPINQKGLLRIHKCLDNDNIPIKEYKYLGGGLTNWYITNNEFADLIAKIINKTDGPRIAFTILTHLFYQELKEGEQRPQKLLLSTREVIIRIDWSEDSMQSDIIDASLSKIISECFNGEDAFNSTEIFLQNVISSLVNQKNYFKCLEETFKTIANIQPVPLLNILLYDNYFSKYQKNEFLNIHFGGDESPISNIDDETIITWCKKDPNFRYNVIAKLIPLFKLNDQDKIEWRSIFWSLLQNTSNLVELLPIIEETIPPSFTTQSISAVLQRRLPLLQSITNHPNSVICSWAMAAVKRFEKDIRYQKEHEEFNNHRQIESFE